MHCFEASNEHEKNNAYVHVTFLVAIEFEQRAWRKHKYEMTKHFSKVGPLSCMCNHIGCVFLYLF
jgi:hypothetical protein